MGEAIGTDDEDEDEDDNVMLSLVTLKRRSREEDLPLAEVMRPTKKGKMDLENKATATSYLLACMKAGKTDGTIPDAD